MKIKAMSVKISGPVFLITSIIKTLNGTVGVKKIIIQVFTQPSMNWRKYTSKIRAQKRFTAIVTTTLKVKTLSWSSKEMINM